MVLGYELFQSSDLITPGSGFFFLMAALFIWDVVWRGIGMWKSARNSHLIWFVAILVFNTLGILPIVYLLFFQKRKRLVVDTAKGVSKPEKARA